MEPSEPLQKLRRLLGNEVLEEALLCPVGLLLTLLIAGTATNPLNVFMAILGVVATVWQGARAVSAWRRHRKRFALLGQMPEFIHEALWQAEALHFAMRCRARGGAGPSSAGFKSTLDGNILLGADCSGEESRLIVVAVSPDWNHAADVLAALLQSRGPWKAVHAT